MKAEKLMAAKLRGEAWPISVRWRSKKKGRFRITKCWTIKGHTTTLYLPPRVDSYDIKWHPNSSWSHISSYSYRLSWIPEDDVGNGADPDDTTAFRVRNRRTGKRTLQKVVENPL